MGLFDKIAGAFRSAPPPQDLGRNDPCWCGSGRKYKKCHLDADQRKLQGQRRTCVTS